MRLLIIFWFMGLSSFLHAQIGQIHDTVESKLQKELSTFYKSYPQEKVFVHIDQTTYISGQSIWYKVYSMAFGKPSTLSKIAYIVLKNNKGQDIVLQTLELTKGTAYGSIVLPDSLQTGWYYLRSYTAYMLNFEENNSTWQKIYIQNIQNNSQLHADSQRPKKYTITFYPEGGDLIEGNICNIAFKALDEVGKPVKITGDIVFENKKIKKMNTLHDGMGIFEVETFSDRLYKAIVRFPDNSIQVLPLPTVKKRGFSMRVASINSEVISLKISYNSNEYKKKIIIAAMQSNGTSATYPIDLSRGINLVDINIANYSTGIVRLTLFDVEGIPEAERLVFVDNNDRLKVTLQKNVLSFKQKAQNTFSITVQDKNGTVASTNLSVAIIDARFVTAPMTNIVSHFLLTSELQGYVYNPNYYFQNESDSLKKQLDLVMLTNGWRHFKWKKILSQDKKYLKFAPEQSLFIWGRIENFNVGDKSTIKLTIINSDSTVKHLNAIPDSSGNFIIDNSNLHGNAIVIAEAFDFKNRPYPIKAVFGTSILGEISLPIDSLIDSKTEPELNIDNSMQKLDIQDHFKSSAKEIDLKAVDIKAMKLSPLEQVIKNHVKHFDVEKAYDLDIVHTHSLPTTNIIEFIRGKFPSLNIGVGANGQIISNYRGVSTLINTSGDSNNLSEDSKNIPYFYVDETPVPVGIINTLSLFEVALIRFVPPPVVFAPLMGGTQGAILIYTKNFNDNKLIPKTYSMVANHYTVRGYNVIREFVSPNYSVLENQKVQDLRTTLYWNANLNILPNENIRINFFNSDYAKSYQVIVQGVDTEGHIAYLNTTVN